MTLYSMLDPFPLCIPSPVAFLRGEIAFGVSPREPGRKSAFGFETFAVKGVSIRI